MRWSILVFLLCFSALGYAQSDKLVAEHASLTSDCKAVRGHAQGIVSEASQSELNRDVTLAQAQEVAKALQSMEKRLTSTKKLLTADQLKTVQAHYTSLEGLCRELQAEIGDIQTELEKSKPDRIKVRNLALDLRTKMKDGSTEHDLMKKKLGIR